MAEPKLAAAVMLLRRGAAGTEVYLVRRDPRLVFLGGFHAFPGGSLEAVDAQVKVEAAPLDSEFCSAAVRELFEETGVLLATGADRLAKHQYVELRRALNADAAVWPRMLAEHRLTLDGKLLTPMGNWTTPPYAALRFRAHYLAAWLPAGQSPEIWPGELSDGQWVPLADIIDRHNRAELYITFPVLETLKVLVQRHGDVAKASHDMTARGREPFPLAGGEMLAGVHVVPLKTNTLPPATHTNTYILGGRDLVIVDPGTPFEDEQDRLLQYLALLKSRGGEPREMWLTHHHQDHVGAVDRLRRELKIKVAAHRRTADELGGDIVIDRLLDDGEVVKLHTGHSEAEWAALYTPGHAAGHLCFYERSLGTLLSGDNVLGMGSVLVALPGGDMTEYLASLRRLRALRLGFLFPGHGPPVATAAEKIQEYIEHRMKREADILAALGEARTPSEIVARVYTDTPPTAHALAELSVRAHLAKLVSEGRVREQAGRFVRTSG